MRAHFVQASQEVMAMMTIPAPSPFEDEAGFLAHSLSFAKRIAGTGYPIEEDAYRALTQLYKVTADGIERTARRNFRTLPE